MVACNQVSRPYAGYLERAFHTPFNSGLFLLDSPEAQRFR